MKFKNKLNQAIGKIIKNTSGMISTKLQNICYPKEKGEVGSSEMPWELTRTTLLTPTSWVRQ